MSLFRLPLLRALRHALFARLLRRQGVRFDQLPALDGPLPCLENLGEMHIGPGMRLRAFRLAQRLAVKRGGILRVGAGAFINDGVTICASQSILIGNDVKIGDMAMIYDSDFHAVSPDRPVKQAPVVIGHNVWIGAHAKILAGSRIGDHSVIGAGAVVSGEIPPRSVVVGMPARVVRRFEADDDWVRR